MYSIEFKARAVVHYCEFLKSLRKVAQRYNIGKSSLARWVKDWGKTPRPKPRRQRHSCKAKRINNLLTSFLDLNPFAIATDASCHLQDQGIHVSLSTIYRTLRGLGYTYKCAQNTRGSVGARPDHPFFSQSNVYDTSISVDECSFSVSEPPRRGWSRKGTRVRKGKVLKGHRVSLLLAINRSHVVAYKVVKGGVNASTFRDFVLELPHRSSLILDNASIHKARVVKDVMQKLNITALHPPPLFPVVQPS